jgi:hypothetical protein
VATQLPGWKDTIPEDNYEGVEQTSDVNATEQGQRPRRIIIPTWKVTENQLDPETSTNSGILN